MANKTNIEGATVTLRPVIGLCIAMTCATVSAEGIKGAAVAAKFGNWTVYRSLNPINDKVTCTGLLKGDVSVQLVSNALYIPVSGGIKSITLRFGDGAANAMRLPQEIENNVRAIIVDSSEFASSVETKRVRGQILTLISGVFSFDLDLAAIQEALDSIRSDCPIQPEPTAAPPKAVAPVVPAKKDAEPTCSEKLLARMKDAKLSPKQVSRLCAP